MGKAAASRSDGLNLSVQELREMLVQLKESMVQKESRILAAIHDIAQKQESQLSDALAEISNKQDAQFLELKKLFLQATDPSAYKGQTSLSQIEFPKFDEDDLKFLHQQQQQQSLGDMKSAAAVFVPDKTESQSSESSSDQLPPSGYEYQVFLSFRGSDTRKGFTDCLYNALADAGIRTFRDDEELRTGEEIGANLIKAIMQSKISIPVFSKDYASSKWCLKELAFMLACKNQGDHMILPVFYDVTPSVVRHQAGNYARAFEQHVKKYDSNIVQQWRNALTEVGGFNGWESENVANGHQGKLIKSIVAKVLVELKKAQLFVTKNLVGIDDQVEAFKGLLELGANDVRILGIWGMGGIGKSTLAKVIYNQILNSFDCCSFLNDIRETSRGKGLPYLQSSLVSDLSRRERKNFTSIDAGKNEIMDRYRDRKVLILLDDIDQTSQLDALVMELDSFGGGSRIIVTTRNRNVLDDRVKCVYEVKEMNEHQALELFCKHAFRMQTPTDEFRTLSCDIAKTAAGHPLALEVIGSYLSGKNKAIWNGTLEKLKSVPHVAIQDKLQISYQALEPEEKEIFLDIACHFIGEDINDAFHMWKDCNLFPEVGIDVLLALSLIKIGDDNNIWMHDQVRDLGREIVRKESNGELGMRSRLWCSDEAMTVLRKQKGSPNVKAIRVSVYGDNNVCFTSEWFRNLSNLRLLDLKNNVGLRGDFGKLLSSLRWLRWRGCSFNSLTNLHLPNLVFLDLSWSQLTDDWKGWGSIQMMKLKVLDLSGCEKLTRSPHFSSFPSLERLSLLGCSELRMIDPSIGKLKNLTHLHISCCSNLLDLPSQLWSLENLKILDANCCKCISKIPSFTGYNLTSLSDLQLNSTNISKLPDSIGFLHGLQVLKLDKTSISSVPDSIGTLTFLKVLILSQTNVWRLPDSINCLFNLETLDLSNCQSLEILPSLPGSLPSGHQVDQVPALMKLDISLCQNLEELANLSNLKLLRDLDVGGCEKLRELAGLDELELLEKLTISGLMTELPNLSNLKLLRQFCICGCEGLQEVRGLDELNSLEILAVSQCKELETLPDLSELLLLQEIYVDKCEKLRELTGLEKLENLQALHISECKQLEELPNLSKLGKLQVLKISNCEKFVHVSWLEDMDPKVYSISSS